MFSDDSFPPNSALAKILRAVDDMNKSIEGLHAMVRSMPRVPPSFIVLSERMDSFLKSPVGMSLGEMARQRTMKARVDDLVGRTACALRMGR